MRWDRMAISSGAGAVACIAFCSRRQRRVGLARLDVGQDLAPSTARPASPLGDRLGQFLVFKAAGAPGDARGRRNVGHHRDVMVLWCLRTFLVEWATARR